MRLFDVKSRSCNGFFVRSILTDVGSRVVYFSVLDVVAISLQATFVTTFVTSYISSFMGKKCCFALCRSNYDQSKAKSQILKERNNNKNEDRNVRVATFGFPNDPGDRKKWIRAVPYMSEDDFNGYKCPPVLCAKHWPSDFETTKSVNGKIRPKHPPTVFPGVPSSEIPTPEPLPRPTKRASFEVRTTLEDQMGKFLEADRLSNESLVLTVATRKFEVPVTTFLIDNVQWIQSNEFIHGIPLFALKIFKDMTFRSFHMGIQCSIPTLYRNNIYRLNTWSRIDEALRSLSRRDFSHHEKILQQQIDAMKPIRVGKKVYTPETLVRAFEYYSTSRCLYGKLRHDFKLPSEKTMENLTSKVNNLSDKNFLMEVFSNLKDERQMQCVVMVDEIYLKLALLYHAGKLFGKAENNKNVLANAACGIMIKCLFGGPSFLFKMVPVRGMSAEFLFEQVEETLKLIKSVGGTAKVNVYDGNRTNQSLFKTFDTVMGKPWLTTDGMFLLYDYVHLMKNIRNNWLTEPSGELEFYHRGEKFTAKWSHLLDLQEREEKSRANDSGVRGMSRLNQVSVQPQPIERQNVATCLRVFCDETISALRNHPEMDSNEVEGTALFIDKVVTMWKILNVRSKNKDVRRMDPLVAVVESPDDPRLTYLLEMAKMFSDMEKSGKGKRSKQLTRDTSRSLVHTLKGIVELCKEQLSTTHRYVMLGEYSNDPIERAYGKLRQGSGGTYFLSVQQVMEKLDINKTKLLLRLNVDVSNLDVNSGHECDKCVYQLDDEATAVFDNLSALEDKISRETKMSLVHMAGYVTRKDEEKSEENLLGMTTFYFQQYGDYTRSLDGGGLNYPDDFACQWTFFCFTLFNTVKDKVCRKSLSSLFMLVSEQHSFGMQRHHAYILSNIFFKNYCTASTPRSSREGKQKILKLSDKN